MSSYLCADPQNARTPAGPRTTQNAARGRWMAPWHVSAQARPRWEGAAGERCRACRARGSGEPALRSVPLSPCNHAKHRRVF